MGGKKKKQPKKPNHLIIDSLQFSSPHGGTTACTGLGTKLHHLGHESPFTRPSTPHARQRGTIILTFDGTLYVRREGGAAQHVTWGSQNYTKKKGLLFGRNEAGMKGSLTFFLRRRFFFFFFFGAPPPYHVHHASQQPWSSSQRKPSPPLPCVVMRGVGRGGGGMGGGGAEADACFSSCPLSIAALRITLPILGGGVFTTASA